MRFRLPALTVVLALGLAHCGGLPPKVARSEHPRPPATDVSEDAFATAVRDLLGSEPETPDRAARLQGVASRQMIRASARFQSGNVDRALAAVQGALALVRSRELTKDTLGKLAPLALGAAAKEYASRGDEGRAWAIYEVLWRTNDDAGAKDHLSALQSWLQAQGGKPMLVAAHAARAAVARRILEPSDVAAEEATQAVFKAVQVAMQIRATFRQRQDLTQEEAYEARRTLESAGLTVVAIHLRDADAAGALAAVDRGKLRPLVREETLRALERVVEHADPQGWLELLRSLAPGEQGTEDESPVDRDLLRTAAFAIACEAYRLDPTQIEAALFVADGLQAFGMSEASPAVLYDAVRAHPDARVVGAALGITLRAMAGEAEAQDPDAARRAFVAAQPLLKIADGVKGTQPTPARVRATMGEIELREGRLAQARQLLLEAAATDVSGAVLLSLARIERHQKDSKSALAHLQQALQAPDTARDAALRGEILLMTSDIVRESGDLNGARTPLTEALKQLSASRNAPAPDDRARVERVLGQVLSRFGADKPAQRAFERSLDAAPRDKVQVSATLGVAIARAFVRGDLAAAREGLERSLMAELDDGDLVYHALWVRLLERQLRQKPSAAVDRVFATIADDGRWIGKLAAFGAGKIKADELVRSAKTEVQRTEALFYSAMDRRASGDTKGADEALHQVISSPGVDLIETQMARDLLGGASASLGPLPSNISIP
jgi:tetratricopeptide (TPR) repeat protein